MVLGIYPRGALSAGSLLHMPACGIWEACCILRLGWNSHGHGLLNNRSYIFLVYYLMEMTFLSIVPNFIALFWGVTTRLQAELIKYFKDTAKLRLRELHHLLMSLMRD